MDMAKMSHHLKTVVLLVILHTVTSDPVKVSDRPVHETINEQARSDDIKLFLPYSNPLAGNSLQNAKLHAQHQQAMFNAEKVRQHRAQIMRWNQVPTKADLYMRAYHDLEESQQLEMEKEQSTIQDRISISPAPPPKQRVNADTQKRNNDRNSKKNRNHRSRGSREERKLTSAGPPRIHEQYPNEKLLRAALMKAENQRQTPKNAQIKTGTLLDKRGPELTKAAGGYAVVNRNHRSHGSLEYNKYFPSNHGTVQFEPAPTYDQGVFIKTRSNIGFANAFGKGPSKLYSEASPNKIQYVLPRQYGQEYNQYISNDVNQYLNAQNIGALQTLLQKRPQEQANQLNALLENYNTQQLRHPIVYNVQPYQTYQQAYAGYIGNLNQNYQVPTTTEVFKAPASPIPVREFIKVVPQIQQPLPLVHPTVATPPQLIKQPDVTKYIKNQPVLLNPHNTEVTVEKHKVNYYGDVPTVHPLKVEYKPEIKHPVVPIVTHNYYSEGSEKSYQYNRPGVQHLSQDGIGVPAYSADDVHYARNYEFGYRVKDVMAGSDFGHYENKSGKNTDGHYHVLLPDGRLQTVKYTAGPDGFHADISYDKPH